MKNQQQQAALSLSEESDDTRRRKTAGNIADGLRCCIWCRAEKPEKMIWGGSHQTGYLALLHPNALGLRQPQYLAEHRLLSFLGKKICPFIHDFHPKWIARLGLQDSNGSTTSWCTTCRSGSCDGFSRSSLNRGEGPSHCSPGSTLATLTSWELNCLL